MFIIDSGGLTYDTFWMDTSLRGLSAFIMKIKVLKLAVHSGSSGGIVPAAFDIARQLLDRLENAYTGNVIEDL